MVGGGVHTYRCTWARSMGGPRRSTESRGGQCAGGPSSPRAVGGGVERSRGGIRANGIHPTGAARLRCGRGGTHPPLQQPPPIQQLRRVLVIWGRARGAHARAAGGSASFPGTGRAGARGVYLHGGRFSRRAVVVMRRPRPLIGQSRSHSLGGFDRNSPTKRAFWCFYEEPGLVNVHLHHVNPTSKNNLGGWGGDSKTRWRNRRAAERQQYLEARQPIMMLMRIKQLGTCSP